jgi:hypothetical protein
VWEIFAAGDRAHRLNDIAAMLLGLHRAIDVALRDCPKACPLRWSCALELALKRLFGPTDGAA